MGEKLTAYLFGRDELSYLDETETVNYNVFACETYYDGNCNYIKIGNVDLNKTNGTVDTAVDQNPLLKNDKDTPNGTNDDEANTNSNENDDEDTDLNEKYNSAGKTHSEIKIKKPGEFYNSLGKTLWTEGDKLVIWRLEGNGDFYKFDVLDKDNKNKFKNANLHTNIIHLQRSAGGNGFVKKLSDTGKNIANRFGFGKGGAVERKAVRRSSRSQKSKSKKSIRPSKKRMKSKKYRWK